MSAQKKEKIETIGGEIVRVDVEGCGSDAEIYVRIEEVDGQVLMTRVNKEGLPLEAEAPPITANSQPASSAVSTQFSISAATTNCYPEPLCPSGTACCVLVNGRWVCYCA